MRCRAGSERSRAFSLAELLVVIGVVGLVLGLTLPAIQRVRESAARLQCQNNLRQVGIGLHNFHVSHNRLPPARPERFPSNEPESLLSWMALILAHMDQIPLWEETLLACKIDTHPYHSPPHVGYTTVIPSYVCPTDERLRRPQVTPSGDRAAFGSYVGVSGTSRTPFQFLPGALGLAPGMRLTDIRDGTSNTLMVGERPPPDSLQAGRWYSRLYVLEHYGGPDCIMAMPEARWAGDLECARAGSSFGPGRTDNPCDRFHYWSLHPRGANFLFADGSVHFVRYTASALLPSLASASGGESGTIADIE
jgi:prepilin-type processing-associated H-X9-DG protein